MTQNVVINCCWRSAFDIGLLVKIIYEYTGDWSTVALDPGVWYTTVRKGGCKFMTVWVKEEENASKHRQRKREAEGADKVEVAPAVTVARFETLEKPETL